MVKKKRGSVAELNKIKDLDTTGDNMSGLTRRHNVMDEIDKINKKATVDTHTIKVIDKVDHYNISLWTKWGQRKGPMHRENAIATLHRFAKIGIDLAVDQPTADQIEAYNKSPEGKKRLDDVARKRGIKEKSSKKGSIEKMAESIAKSTGQAVDAVNRILDKPVSPEEGRAKAGV